MTLARRRAVAVALTMVLGAGVIGCGGGSDDGSSPPPAPSVTTRAPDPTRAPDAAAGTDDAGRDDTLSDDEIAGIEKELDAIDRLLDDLDQELRSD